jgi:uncharacterized protein YgiM (DUF1202 family)
MMPSNLKPVQPSAALATFKSLMTPKKGLPVIIRGTARVSSRSLVRALLLGIATLILVACDGGPESVPTTTPVAASSSSPAAANSTVTLENDSVVQNRTPQGSPTVSRWPTVVGVVGLTEERSPTVSPTEVPRPTATPQPTDTPLPPSNTPITSLQGVVNDDNVNLRTGPSFDYPSLGKYSKGSTLTVLGKEPSHVWLQVSVSGERTGWMMKQYINVSGDLGPVPLATAEPAPTRTSTPIPTPDAVVNDNNVNLRTGPGFEYPSLGQYSKGTLLNVLGKEATLTWLHVSLPGGHTGWMMRQYMNVHIDLTTVPVASTPPAPRSERAFGIPSYIKAVTAYKEGYQAFVIYFILADSSGQMISADGLATLTIEQVDYSNSVERRLLKRTYSIAGSDFVSTTIGLGAFGRDALIYLFGRWEYTDFDRLPTGTRGQVTVTFTTSDGRTLEGKEIVYFDR